MINQAFSVTDVKINGLTNPRGYHFDTITVSWKVSAVRDRRQKEAAIIVALDREMKNIVALESGQQLNSTAQIVHMELEPRMVYYVQVRVTGEAGGVSLSKIAFFETGKRQEQWSAAWIGTEAKDLFHPVFEKKVNIYKTVKRGRLYICGLGLYEAYIDEKKVGDECLTPFFNDYSLALQSQVYDITEMLKNDSTLTVMLGNGWYKGRLGYDGRQAIYGDRFALIAEIHLEYEDGSVDTIATDSSWKYYASDIEMSDIYDGETQNRLLYANKENPRKQAEVLDLDTSLLTDRYSMPLKVMEEVTVKEVINTPAGEVVLDFGQNFSGYIAFNADFAKGTRIVLTHGEILQNGNFYNENYRTAKAQFTYVSDGRREEVHPHFTYMGFRYVKVEGWNKEINREDFIGKAIYSAMVRTGYLETGHGGINQLISNALWGLKSNFVDMPTDCPQRDERLGWTGDAQVFASTASFFMDTKAFYRKYLWDMRNDQVLRDGAIANYLPNINQEPGGSSVWGDAATFIPTALYETFGDKELLKDCYPIMKDWVEWICRGDKNRAGGPKYLFDFGFSFGDWLAMDGITEQSFKGGTEDAYVSSVYYYASVNKLTKAAQVLGLRGDYEKYQQLADKIKEAILYEYFALSGRLTIDTQTSYIIALYFGIYREKKPLIEGLRKRLKRDGYRIKCGFVGAPLICEVLAENEMADLAMRLLLQEEYPSWLHCVNLGATTIWERWNSVLDDGSISGTGMNSLNHYAYGAVVHYIVQNIAGLKPMAPGYTKVLIKPQFDVRLKYLNCTYHSPAGIFVLNWSINGDGTINVHYEVPFDCEAIIELPGYSNGKIRLETGTKDITYEPTKDYRCLYSWNTLLEDLSKDKKAMEVLEKELPAAYGMAKRGDKEDLGLTLEELKYMSWFGLEREDVEQAAEKLFKIKFEV